MPRIRWERNKEGKLVKVDPEKFNFSDGKVTNHINMRRTWSGQTKVEFNTTTVEQSVNKMLKGKK